MLHEWSTSYIASCSKIYMTKSRVHPLCQKKQGGGFLFSLLNCFFTLLCQNCPSSFLWLFSLYLVDVILAIRPWSLHFHRDLLQVSWKERKLLTCISFLCRHTSLVDHHLPALCPPWVGDNWLVIIRHYYGYYFHFKKSWRHTVQGHRRKGIFRQTYTSYW